MKGYLSPNIMLELEELFQRKNWEINQNEDARKSLFQRYCERMKLLDEKEQKFLIDLSLRFEVIGINDYVEFFLMSLHLLDENILSRKEQIIITPLSKPYIEINDKPEKIERQKMKSGDFLYFYLSREDLRWIDYFYKFDFIEKISSIKKKFIENKTHLIVIDDFIGTGESAINCISIFLEEIAQTKSINPEDISVITIAAMQEGMENVYNKLGVKVYSDIVQKKAISDCFPKSELEKKKDIMLNIEKKLKCPPNYSFGYGKSEALFSFMDKAPNNTFPAYWFETKTKIAPFPRFKNYK